jgi:hypothetical protein
VRAHWTDLHLASYPSAVLNPTPNSRLVNAQGQPYFLGDQDMTLDTFVARLRDEDLDRRAYYIGKLMRQAKPDDVFTFVTKSEIEALWPRLERYLGNSRPFWVWAFDAWRKTPREQG